MNTRETRRVSVEGCVCMKISRCIRHVCVCGEEEREGGRVLVGVRGREDEGEDKGEGMRSRG